MDKPTTSNAQEETSSQRPRKRTFNFSKGRSASAKVAKLNKSAPLIDTRILGKNARAGLVASEKSERFFKLLGTTPARLVFALCEIMDNDHKQTANPFYETHAEIFADIHEAAAEQMTELPENMKNVYPYHMAVLAAYLGATNLPHEDDLVSEETYCDESEEMQLVDPKSRNVTALRAVHMASVFKDGQGHMYCYCGKPALFKQQTKWGSQEKISYFVCEKERCRMHTTLQAILDLEEDCRLFDVVKIPEFFCPAHPDSDIKISRHEKDSKGNQDVYTQIRCGNYNKDAKDKYCVSTILASNNDCEITGTLLWKIFDLVSQF